MCMSVSAQTYKGQRAMAGTHLSPYFFSLSLYLGFGAGPAGRHAFGICLSLQPRTRTAGAHHCTGIYTDAKDLVQQVFVQ